MLIIPHSRRQTNTAQMGSLTRRVPPLTFVVGARPIRRAVAPCWDLGPKGPNRPGVTEGLKGVRKTSQTPRVDPY